MLLVVDDLVGEGELQQLGHRLVGPNRLRADALGGFDILVVALGVPDDLRPPLLRQLERRPG